MTPTPGIVCQKAGVRNGRAPHKYCDATSCIQEGIDAGHIARGGKRQRAQSRRDVRTFLAKPSFLERFWLGRFVFFPLSKVACVYLSAGGDKQRTDAGGMVGVS